MSKFKIEFKVRPVSGMSKGDDNILKDRVLERYPNVNLGEDELMPFRDMGGFIAIEVDDRQVFDRPHSKSPEGVEVAHTRREIIIEDKYFYWDFLCVVLLELCQNTIKLVERKPSTDKIYSSFGDSDHGLYITMLSSSNVLVEFHSCGLERENLKTEISIHEFGNEVLRVCREYVQALVAINPRLKEHPAVKKIVTLCDNLEMDLASEKP